jgi:fructose 1,6-bisphosphate aldolase/phosphatase
MKITLSVIKADIGGYVGHSTVHPECEKIAERELERARAKGLLIDYRATHCGDDLELIMTHKKGEDNKEIHKLAWDIFVEATKVAKRLKLYGAGQDLLKTTFSGNVKGMGPGVAELEMEERESEPVVVFMADKTEPGAWNFPLYKMFADPFNTPGLILDPAMASGFRFEVHDIVKHKKIFFDCPEGIYDLLMYIGAPGRYVIKYIFRKSDKLKAASSSTQRLRLIAGKYTGKDDPVMIVRSQKGLPAIGEVLEPFAFPYMVAGWMRGSHHGPLMPVSIEDAHCSRFDGPPLVVALGFQLSDGHLVGPRDMFKGPQYDRARQRCNKIADYFRQQGPFEPHRLPLEDLEYTTMKELMERLKNRWTKI